MPDPLIFIGHKHSDRAIANVIRSFFAEQSSGMLRVFQSSDPAASGPRTARYLNVELRKALWEASAVILVYTTEDKDWGYCMRECGVAIQQDSPDTSVRVLQCGPTVPDLFAGQLHVDARDGNSVEKFVREFMTDLDFLPNRNEAITGYDKSHPKIGTVAAKLFDDLKAVIPEGPVKEWPAHPFLQLQLPELAAKRIADAPVDQRRSVADRTVRSEITVSDADKYAAPLFGMADFRSGMKLEDLFSLWHAGHGEASVAWLDNLIDQIAKAAQWQFPALKGTAMVSANGGLHAPVVTRVRKIPSSAAIQFDVYFFPFNVLEATPARSRMVPRKDMFCKTLEDGGEKTLKIMDVLRELDELQFNRVPFVDREDRLVYIVHRQHARSLRGKAVRQRSCCRPTKFDRGGASRPASGDTCDLQECGGLHRWRRDARGRKGGHATEA